MDKRKDIGVPVGTHLRLRKVDDNLDLNCSVWRQDMDGKDFMDAVDREVDGDRLLIITETAYADIVRRLRSVGLSKI